MPRCWILSLVLVAVDDPPKPFIDLSRTKRAAIVDRYMFEPAAPRFRANQTLTTELIEVSEPAGEGEANNEPLIKKTPAAQELMLILERENFDRWIFGNLTDDRTRRDWLEHRLGFKCEQAARSVPFLLSRPQMEKLQLAGRGDVKRFFDRVEASRPEFDAVRKDLDAGHRFLLNDLKPLCAQFKDGPFGADSLFAKTLRKIENDTLAARPTAK